MPRATSNSKCTVLLVVVLALLVGHVHGWATLKKILMARLLSGPRVIAVPVPVPSGHHHHPPPPPHPHPPHHHHHHMPHPPPPPPLLPVPVPVHHYHYPPTNVWEAPLPKSPGVTEVTDLSHLHALFDAPAETPTKAAHHIDVIDYSAAAEALSSASSSKPSKASPSQSVPTYSERTATKRPVYNPYRSGTYYSAEIPHRYYSPPAVSAHEDKSYAPIDYDSYVSKALTTAARKPYGPRYLDAADHPAYMAALKQYMKEKHISSLESAWSRQPTSYQAESAKWPTDDSSSAYKAADYSSQYKNYGWAAYPASSYGKEEQRDTSKQYAASPDSYDWARYVASAYKAAAEKASSQSPAAARYDTEAHNTDAYAALSSTTTEPAPSSEKYEADEKDEGLPTLASATSTTSKTPTDLVAPDPPPATTVSSKGAGLAKKD